MITGVHDLTLFDTLRSIYLPIYTSALDQNYFARYGSLIIQNGIKCGSSALFINGGIYAKGIGAFV